jgi:hypothetical protein
MYKVARYYRDEPEYATQIANRIAALDGTREPVDFSLDC